MSRRRGVSLICITDKVAWRRIRTIQRTPPGRIPLTLEITLVSFFSRAFPPCNCLSPCYQRGIKRQWKHFNSLIQKLSDHRRFLVTMKTFVLCIALLLCCNAAPSISSTTTVAPPSTTTVVPPTPTAVPAVPSTVGAPSTTAVPGPVDRECACTVEKIWLDIVVIVDITEAMDQQGPEHQHRSVAADIFAEGGSQRNRKETVLLYASAYNQGGYSDPKETAIQMRDSGIEIITVAYVQASETNEILKIGELASPTFAFSNSKTKDLIETISDAFCKINCFCPTNWAQFSDSYTNPGAHKYGVCVRYVGIEASWFAANAIGCRNKGSFGSYLVTEFSSTKQRFNKAYYTDANNQTGSSGGVNYHIGLRTNVPHTTGYVWVQGTSKYIPFNSNNFHAWGAGYPNANLGDCVTVRSSSFLVQWENTNCFTNAQNYLCETTACDTDNYCDNIDGDF
uniref:C-type lectin domain-containing protein n=1 Tax=Steinernema glaseri TaxID=37863 RepID=A0A1I8AWK2_9BILA